MQYVTRLFCLGLLVLLSLVLRLPAVAQAPAWQAAQTVAAPAGAFNNISEVTATAVDAAGNIFLAGNFTNSVVLGGITLTSVGGYDVFVAKFNPATNQFVWAQRAGGASGDYANALAVSGTSVYVAGSFESPTAGFGPATLTISGTTNAADVFVAKLTDAGSTASFAWAQRAGGTDRDFATALAVSGTSVYVAGNFISAMPNFGATSLANANGNGGTYDAFVAKLTDTGGTGSFAWAQRAGGIGNEFATAVAASSTNVYVAGSFASATVAFGATPLTNANVGLADVFVAKLTDAGNSSSFTWAQRAGGTSGDNATALALSGTSVYVAGYFAGFTARFGPATLTNASRDDVFVAKLTDAGSTGSFVWAQQAGSSGEDKAPALAASGASLYVAGEFRGPTASFGTTTLANTGATGSSDVFVANLIDGGSTGRFAWAQRAGGTDFEFANALALSGTGVYVAGYFLSATAGFGPITLSNPGPGFRLGFLATLTDPTLTATTTAAPQAPAQLFPNPARHTATLRLPAGTATAPLTLADALGRPVRRYPAPAAPETALDLRGLPAGLYLLRGAGPAHRLAVE